MAWLRRSNGGAPAAPAVDAAVEAPVTGPPSEIEHSARGFEQALERLPRPRGRVLDLGPALASNIAFFNRLGSRLRVADLEGSLREIGLWPPTSAEPARWDREMRSLLAAGADERYDLVLAWDLPNYFGRDRWPAIATVLVERLAPRGILYLLARTGHDMPARPSLFRWKEADRLHEEPRGTASVAPPKLTHGEIERLHRGLAAAHSFLGKLGLQEFLLEHTDEAHMLPLPEARAGHPHRR